MTAGALLLISFSIALTVPAVALAEEKAPVRHYAWETAALADRFRRRPRQGEGTLLQRLLGFCRAG